MQPDAHPNSQTPRSRVAALDAKNALLWIAFAFCVYGFFCPYFVLSAFGEIRSPYIHGNENSHIALVRAIVEQGTFEVGGIPGYTGDLALAEGTRYSNKPPGFALLLVPWYALFYHVALPHLTGNIVPNFLYAVPAALGALSIGLVYLLTLELGGSRRAASYGALLTGFATIVLVYSTLLFNNIATVFFTLLTIWAAFVYGRTGRPGFFVLACFTAGYCGLTKYTAPVLLIPVGIYLTAQLIAHGRDGHPCRTLACGVVALLLPLVVLACYHHACFGAFYSISYTHERPGLPLGHTEAYMGQSIARGIWNILFGRARGVFVHTPVLLAAVPGAFWAARHPGRRGQLAVLATAIAIYVLLWSPYLYWHGGSSFGARHTLPVVPLLGICAALCYDRLSRRGRLLMLAATIPSVVVHAILVLLNHHQTVILQTWTNKDDPGGGRLAHLYGDILVQAHEIFHLPAQRGGILGSGAFTWMKLLATLTALALGGVLVARYLRTHETAQHEAPRE